MVKDYHSYFDNVNSDCNPVSQEKENHIDIKKEKKVDPPSAYGEVNEH